MSEVKTIKDIDNETWHEFKDLAAQNNVKMGLLFKSMVHNYKKNAEKTWHKILNSGKILSDEDAADLRQKSQKIRKEYGFRV